LSVLDEILKDWALEPAPNNTITGVSLAKVQQSELERMFKVLLHRWCENNEVPLGVSPDLMHPPYSKFELRFANGAEWTIREQVELPNHHTVPDFYAERVDRPGTAPVAIFLDGWQFHGANPDDVDGDAQKRLSLRGAGMRVWTLTYDDVNVALKAAADNIPTSSAVPVTSSVRHKVRQKLLEQQGKDQPTQKVLEVGAMDQLMLALSHPEDDAWKQTAEVVMVGAFEGSSPLFVADAAVAVDQAAVGAVITNLQDPSDIAASQWSSVHGHRVTTVLRRRNDNTSVIAVLSYDSSVEPDRHIWTDWHHLANLAQYMDDNAVITTTRSHVSEQFVDVVPAAAPSGSPDVDLNQIYDPVALELTRQALSAGYTEVLIGLGAGDLDDTPIEAQWLSAKVGIVASGVTPPDMGKGWTIRPSDQWTTADLLAALETGVR
jgi:hypothetical protein